MTSRTTATTGGVIRWVVGVILVGHGLIHLIGPLEIWDLADLPETIGRPSVDPGAAATNLQAHPEAGVDLADGQRTVKGRAAEREDRSRLWARWREIDTNLDAYAALRSAETAVVILEPSPDPSR